MPNQYTVRQRLVELGLRPEEADIYLLLVARGSLPAKVISDVLGTIVNSIYRSAKLLSEKGLIKELGMRPRQFQAVSPAVAIEQLAADNISSIIRAKTSLIRDLDMNKNLNRLNMGVITGREELFTAFVNLAKKAKQEVLVISIGEPVPESIWSVTKEAIDKNVKSMFIFHKYDKENILLIKRWQSMGVSLRHLPGEGYHLNIFDSNAAILSASNPKQSKERSGVVIYNEAIVEALKAYFYQQWSLSQPI